MGWRRQTERSDADLLLSPSADAFEELYDRHSTMVLRWFYRRTGDADVAADLTAETFAAVFCSRHRFRDVGAPGRAWVMRIAERQLSHFIRAEAVATRARTRLGVDPVVLTEEDYERIESLSDLATMRDALAVAVAVLPAEQALAISLRVVQQRSYTEIAVRLGCTEGAARVRVSRGLSRLATLLEAP